MSAAGVPSFFQKGYKPKTSKPKKAAKSSKNSAAVSQWIEKYRPHKLGDIMSQEEVVSMLRNCVDSVDHETGQIELPNLLMYGPPGTGKTSSALALARELFGSELLHERVLELNASDDRGISVVRTKMKDFSMRTVRMAGLKKIEGRPPAAIKLIILDECDSMTRAAQEALRRTMEKYSQTTRFILIANYVSKIIGPIVSRCCKLRFKPLESTAKINRLNKIADQENIILEPAAIDGLIEIADGDLRRCVNYLQSAVNVIPKNYGTGHMAASTDSDEDFALEDDDGKDQLDENNQPPARTLTLDHVKMVTVQAPTETVRASYQTAKSCSDFSEIQATVNDLAYEAYNCSDILSKLLNLVVVDENLSNLQKCNILEKIGEIDGFLADGGDEKVNLLSIFGHIQLVCKTI